MKCVDDLPLSFVDDHYILIGRNVKKIRESRNITQLELSQALGFKSVGLVSQAELYLKKQHFNIKHLLHISYILECDVTDFFNSIDEKEL